jgi:hypothetical protein
MNTDHTLEVPKFEGDVSNTQLVTANPDLDMVQVRAPMAVMTKDGALILAAWLVALVDRSENFEEFRAILKAVLET